MFLSNLWYFLFIILMKFKKILQYVQQREQEGHKMCRIDGGFIIILYYKKKIQMLHLNVNFYILINSSIICFKN